jgi:hypothetical protein
MPPLTKEQIDELLNLVDQIQPNKFGGYDVPKHLPPKQVGPIRFGIDPASKCRYITETPMHPDRKMGMCLCPAWVYFKGQPRCSVHALMEANKLLVEMGIRA